jgi:DNA-binding CsgD family transcriptional regulator
MPSPSLTTKERIVLALLRAGKRQKAIAADLVISVNTVNTHSRNLREKLGAGSVPEAVRAGEEAGLFRYLRL